jgi:hypothetical protein
MVIHGRRATELPAGKKPRHIHLGDRIQLWLCNFVAEGRDIIAKLYLETGGSRFSWR